MLAVTTFHPEGYAHYGRRALETLSQYFPGRVIAYTEEQVDEGGPKVEYRDLMAIPRIGEFLERIKKVAGADGITHEGYDYRYDANKFCRKVFAQDAVFDEDEHVFWFDADTVILKPIPEEVLLSLVVKPFCYLGRKKSYTETGFLGFNTKHPEFPAFRAKYLSYFLSGRIFSQLLGWHDCIAFDYAREGIDGRNLTPNGRAFGNVIGESAIGEFVMHLKGPRKFSDARKRALAG